MKPSDFVEFWDVRNEIGDCIVHFRTQEKAAEFLMTYGSEDWLCLKRTIFFADDLDLRKVYESVEVECEGEWMQYTPFGPKRGGTE